jgi:hypothetical protein
VAAPPAMLTLGGRVTIPLLSTPRATVIPLPGAGAVSVIVPLTVFVTPTLLELKVTAMPGWPTFTATLPGWKPEAVAKMVVLPGFNGVMVAVVLVDPAGTVTVGGAVTTLESKTDRAITWPPEPGAGAVARVMVKVPGALEERFSGLGVRVIGFAPAVIVTVEGLLSTNPSFTINWAT